MKCKSCGNEMPEITKTVVIDGVEYETQTHDFKKKLSEITIPEGWRLWTAEECIKLHNSHSARKLLNLADCWFFIEQPFELNREKGNVAWFYADSDWALLDCDGNPSDSNAGLGVRFCRDAPASKASRKKKEPGA